MNPRNNYCLSRRAFANITSLAMFALLTHSFTALKSSAAHEITPPPLKTGELSEGGRRVWSPYIKHAQQPVNGYPITLSSPPPPMIMECPVTHKLFLIPEYDKMKFYEGARDTVINETRFLNLDAMHARFHPTSRAVPWHIAMGDTNDSPSHYDPSAPAEFFVTAGWESADVYTGVDKSSEAGFPLSGIPTSDQVHRTSIYFSKAGIAYKGWAASFTYIQSVDSLYPRFATTQTLFNGNPTPTQRGYQEMDLAINYSHEIIPNILEGTIGYNVYYIPDRAFFGTNFSGEFYTKLTLTSIPYIRPNVTYSRFNSAAHQLRGTFIDIRVDTVTLPVYKGNSVNVGLRPYVALGVDSNLIGDGTDWTALTMGLVMPVNIGKKVIFSVNGNYAFPINGQSPSPSFHSDLGKVGFWGGASVSVRF